MLIKTSRSGPESCTSGRVLNPDSTLQPTWSFDKLQSTTSTAASASIGQATMHLSLAKLAGLSALAVSSISAAWTFQDGSVSIQTKGAGVGSGVKETCVHAAWPRAQQMD